MTKKAEKDKKEKTEVKESKSKSKYKRFRDIVFIIQAEPTSGDPYCVVGRSPSSVFGGYGNIPLGEPVEIAEYKLVGVKKYKSKLRELE